MLCATFGTDSKLSAQVLPSRREASSFLAIALQSFQRQRASGYTTFGRAVAILTLTRIWWIGKSSLASRSNVAERTPSDNSVLLLALRFMSFDLFDDAWPSNSSTPGTPTQVKPIG